MRAIRQYQLLFSLPSATELQFTDDEKATWAGLVSPACSPSQDELDEWHRLSNHLSPAFGCELTSAVMVNEIKSLRRLDIVENELRHELTETLTALYAKTPHSPRLANALSVFRRVKFGGEVFASSLWNKGIEEHVLTKESGRLCPARVIFYVQVAVITAARSSSLLLPKQTMFRFAKW